MRVKIFVQIHLLRIENILILQTRLTHGVIGNTSGFGPDI